MSSKVARAVVAILILRGILSTPAFLRCGPGNVRCAKFLVKPSSDKIAIRNAAPRG